MRKISLFLVFLIYFFIGCAQMQIHKSESKDFKPKKTDLIAIMPFENFTQTPLAGYGAAAVADAVLSEHGFKTKILKSKPDNDDSYNENDFDIDDMIKKAKTLKAVYILSGKVTEWRYKSGIDAEPIVGLVIEITNTQTGERAYLASGGKSGDSRGSISTLSQEILDKILPR